MSPRAEEDTTPKGQSYGAETEQQQFKAAMAKPVQVPVQFPTGEDIPVSEEPPEPDMGPDPSLEIPGLGNLGDLLFADADQSHGVPIQDELPFQPRGPSGPPEVYQRLIRDPRVTDSTRALLSLVSRLGLLAGE